MKKIRTILLFIAILSIILLITRNPIMRLDRYGFDDIDWTDSVFYNGKLYDVEYVSSDNRDKVKIDVSMIDKLLGEVKFSLNDNVSNVHYKLRNWDATFLEKGIKIYSITNVNPSKSIALLEEGLYIKYTVFEIK